MDFCDSKKNLGVKIIVWRVNIQYQAWEWLAKKKKKHGNENGDLWLDGHDVIIFHDPPSLAIILSPINLTWLVIF